MTLNSAQRSALRSHKYNGKDLSFMYNNVLSPFAATLVEYIPRWVAPNLITATGTMVPITVRFFSNLSLTTEHSITLP